MKRNIRVESEKTPDGKSIELFRHDEIYSVRVEGVELMSTRQKNSEELLAQIVCSKLGSKDADVLIGGLGFGYTLSKALSNLTKNSKVLVAELLPCVIEWNSKYEFPQAKSPLSDNRVTVKQGDVADIVLGSKVKYDAIILDVDNGPEAFTVASNDSLYNETGLHIFKHGLAPGGILGVWSIQSNPKFAELMARCGFKVEVKTARARQNKGATHTLFVGSTK